ncbi:MAG: mRNA interferase RelE/StbE [Candidatus Azotimanducaceae bacterium]|jgi:mRNA interferase RelE/StbE
MEYKIEYLDKAEKELEKLPKRYITQILLKIDSLQYFQTATGIKKLRGSSDFSLYRVRSGDYRIIFTVEEDKIVIVIIRIAHRKEVYKKL